MVPLHHVGNKEADGADSEQPPREVLAIDNSREHRKEGDAPKRESQAADEVAEPMDESPEKAVGESG